ncbi:MAG TPA: killer suppression protein [Bacillota bacterium]|jgi:proteic killer suppression protein
MDIYYRGKALGRVLNSKERLIRKYGSERGQMIMRRMFQLLDADNLADFSRLPQTRFHPLRENRKGQYAVNVGYPFRLVFEPAGERLELTADGSVDLSKITVIRIIEVVDYHGE